MVLPTIFSWANNIFKLMSRSEIYSLVLCFAVLVGLLSLFTYFIIHTIKQRVKLIQLGQEDEDIIKEYQKANKKTDRGEMFSKIFSITITAILCAIFAFAIYINLTEHKRANGIPSLKVVQTDSMSYKNSKNTYLTKNNIDDQLQVYDLIITRHLPDEFDLKLYDIVVYEAENGMMTIHRIVGIEEPNSKHPDHRYFKLQGDAVPYPDTFPVTYDQMRGIYVGEKIPFVGSVVMFMQSPAGYFCIGLVLCSIIALPLLEKKIKDAKKQRQQVIIGNQNLQLEQDLTQETFAEDFSQTEQENPVDELIVSVNQQVQEEGLSIQRKDHRNFKQKLADSDDLIKERYQQIVSLISRIDGIRVIEGKKQESFKKGHNPVARFTFRGKTLCILLALNPAEYENTKYIFKDISENKSHSNYPMRLRLTLDRQTRWAKELINVIIKDNGYKLLDESFDSIAVTTDLENIANDKFSLLFKEKLKSSLTFTQRLRRAKKEVKDRYKTIVNYIKQVDGVREIESTQFRTFRIKNKPIAKITIKGKTLNVYLALDPKEFLNTKYIYKDVSLVKKYVFYPMRVRITSERQVKWTCELIEKIMQGYLSTKGV